MAYWGELKSWLFVELLGWGCVPCQVTRSPDHVITFHPQASYEKDVNYCSQSKLVDKLATKLRELIAVCRKYLQHIQKLQKQYHDKHAKPRTYVPGNKVWLNNKYIKTKRNWKLKAKFFGLFWVLHPISKQAYKIKLLKKWKIHDVFHVSLLEKDITKKGRVNETTFSLKFENDGDGKEYKIEPIRNSAVYAKELDSGHHLPGLYYLVSWKSYHEEENIWEPTSAMLYLRKLISTFHCNYPEKPTAIFPPIDSALLMARPTVKPRAKASSKQKWDRFIKDSSASKRAKKIWTSSFLSRFLALSW